MKYLVYTADGFVETVYENELIKWAEYFEIGLEMTISEAIETLEKVGYKVKKLEEEEIQECGENE